MYRGLIADSSVISGGSGQTASGAHRAGVFLWDETVLVKQMVTRTDIRQPYCVVVNQIVAIVYTQLS